MSQVVHYNLVRKKKREGEKGRERKGQKREGRTFDDVTAHLFVTTTTKGEIFPSQAIDMQIT